MDAKLIMSEKYFLSNLHVKRRWNGTLYAFDTQYTISVILLGWITKIISGKITFFIKDFSYRNYLSDQNYIL